PLQPDRCAVDFGACVGRPAGAADARFADGMKRFQNRAACVAELDALFATRTLAEWREQLAAMEGPWAPLQTAAELHDDPQAIANGYLRPVGGGDKGRFALVADPGQFDQTPPAR